MLPYNSGTFCGYQLHSVVINYPVHSFQTKASHAFSFSKLSRSFLAIGNKLACLISLSLYWCEKWCECETERKADKGKQKGGWGVWKTCLPPVDWRRVRRLPFWRGSQSGERQREAEWERRKKRQRYTRRLHFIVFLSVFKVCAALEEDVISLFELKFSELSESFLSEDVFSA